METVYIETSIVSYMRQQPSNHVVTAARQLLTHRWWNDERRNFELVVSQYVIDEASVGSPTLAAERLELLEGIPLLPFANEIPEIASEIMSLGVLPPKAQVDALHIANARILPRIHALLDKLRLPIPIICTPEEMLGNDLEDD